MVFSLHLSLSLSLSVVLLHSIGGGANGNIIGTDATKTSVLDDAGDTKIATFLSLALASHA